MAYQGKYMKPSTRQPINTGSVMMRVALVLLCLVMLSFHLMGSLFARYTTSANSSDDARVAKFNVIVNGAADDLTVICGEDPKTGTYTVTVTNDSEVAVSYKITAALTAPDADNNGTPDFTFAGDAVIADFGEQGNSGALAVGGEATHAITISVLKWSEFTKLMTNENNSVSLDFTVTIDVEQVD